MTLPEPPRPLDGGWGWVTVCGCTMVHFLLTGSSRAFGVFYVVLLDRFQASEGATAFIHSICNILRLSMGPVASALSERFTSRRVVIVGGLITCVGCVASAFASDVVHMYVSFGLIAGVGSALVFTPSLIVVSQYFDKRKGKAMAFSTLGNGLGAFTLAPLFTTLLQQYAYPGAMLILGAMLLNCCVAGALYRPFWQNFSKVIQVWHVKLEGDTTKATHNKTAGDSLEHFTATCQKREECGDETQNYPTIPDVTDNIFQRDKKNNTDEIDKLNANRTKMNGNRKSKELTAVTDHDNVKHTDDKVKGLSYISGVNFGFESPDKPAVPVRIRSPVSHTTEQTRVEKAKLFFSILKNPVFLCYGLVITAMAACTSTFLMLLPALGKSRGYSDARAAWLVSMTSISDVIGRFLAGFFFDLPLVRRHRLHYHVVLGLVPGVIVCLVPVMPTYPTVSCVVCIVGFILSAFNGQRMTVLTDILPRSLLDYSVGWLHLFQGVGHTGPFIAGVLKDRYGSYVVSYLFAGLTMVVFCSLYWIVLIVNIIKIYKKEEQSKVKVCVWKL